MVQNCYNDSRLGGIGKCILTGAIYLTSHADGFLVSDVAIFVLKRDVKLQPTCMGFNKIYSLVSEI